MKKTYSVPTMQVVPVQMTQMLCASIESNVNLRNGGATPFDFDEDDIR
jgi:hypothetical protein